MGTKHYSTETFKPILFCNGMFQIGNFGSLKRIYSVTKYGVLNTSGGIQKMQKCTGGYYRKYFEWYENGERKKKRVYIHRLVALAFIANPENKPCINHKDGNKLNNHVSNLEWCTVAENNAHAIGIGLVKSTPKSVRDYIKSVYNGYNKRKLAKELNMHPNTIYCIATNRDGRGLVKSFERVKHSRLIRYKVIIDTETGEKLTMPDVAKKLGKCNSRTYKIINELGGAKNNTKYKKGEGFICKHADAV